MQKGGGSWDLSGLRQSSEKKKTGHNDRSVYPCLVLEHPEYMQKQRLLGRDVNRMIGEESSGQCEGDT